MCPAESVQARVGGAEPPALQVPADGAARLSLFPPDTPGPQTGEALAPNFPDGADVAFLPTASLP